MDEKAKIKSDLDTVEQLLADAVGRAANLEKIIGVLRGMGGDLALADRALMATYELVGLLSQRRAKLLTTLQSYGGGGRSAASNS